MNEVDNGQNSKSQRSAREKFLSRIQESQDEARRWDTAFMNELDKIETIFQSINDRHVRIRVKQWIEKLSEPVSNPTWKKNRNEYAKLLLVQLQTGLLDKPFLQFPPTQPLQTLPMHFRVRASPTPGIKSTMNGPSVSLREEVDRTSLRLNNSVDGKQFTLPQSNFTYENLSMRPSPNRARREATSTFDSGNIEEITASLAITLQQLAAEKKKVELLRVELEEEKSLHMREKQRLRELHLSEMDELRKIHKRELIAIRKQSPLNSQNRHFWHRNGADLAVLNPESPSNISCLTKEELDFGSWDKRFSDDFSHVMFEKSELSETGPLNEFSSHEKSYLKEEEEDDILEKEYQEPNLLHPCNASLVEYLDPDNVDDETFLKYLDNFQRKAKRMVDGYGKK